MRAIVDRPGSRLMIAALAALALVGMLVVRTTQAAFTASTSNEPNSFSAGNLVLTDDAAMAMFFNIALVPGQSVQRCIEVEYAGTVTDPSLLGEVKLYSGGYDQGPGAEPGSVGLGEHLLLTIDEGTGATYGDDCTGFTFGSNLVDGETLEAFDTARTNYGNGVGTWKPAVSPEARSYRFIVELDPDTPDTEQGAGVTNAQFVWEIQTL